MVDDVGVTVKIETPEITEDVIRNVNGVKEYFRDLKFAVVGVRAKARYARYRNEFSEQLGEGFYYEFTELEIQRIQKLLNELREQFTGSDAFDEEHRRRLLLRLEKLQSELHKRVSDLDRFWGLIGDAGVVVGKLGEDAKPLVDRFREIVEIVWRAQAKAEKLPDNSNPPLSLKGPQTEE